MENESGTMEEDEQSGENMNYGYSGGEEHHH